MSASPTHSRFEYFFGRPRRQWRYAVGMLFLAGMMAFFAVFALMGAWHEPSWPWSLVKGGVGLAAAWGSWHFLGSIFVCSIAPYFDREIGGLSTFGQGEAIAKHCRRLDDLAAGKGAAPLSAFGYADDLKGETVVWHEPGAGLATVSSLLETLSPDGPDRRLVEELAAVRDALRAAESKGAKFSFILRSGDGTNAMEHQLRKGSFF